MAEYIDREAAIERCSKWADMAKTANDEDGFWMADNLQKLIGKIPAADVAPVRRGRITENDACPFCGADMRGES